MSREYSQESNPFLWFLARLAEEAFIIFAVVFLVFLIAEDIKPGFVLNHFNLKKFFFVCLAVGIMALVLSQKKDSSRS